MNDQKQSRRTFRWEEFLRRQKKKRRIMAGILLPGLFACLLLSYRLWQNGQYLWISFGVLGVITGCFFLHFERRKPMAREIVLTAVLTALCVAANEICAHTIPLHAGTFMVILCGIALGPETGFLIGGLARFLCNFFDGQGPWTPWQMLAWGMMGFLAGLVFNKIECQGKLDREQMTLSEKLSLKKSGSFRMVAGPILCILTAWLAAYLLFVLTGGSQTALGQGESFFGWRLYGFGIAGLAAGCLFQRKRLPADPVTTTVFTFFIVFLLYGGIMNFAALLMTHGSDPKETPLTIASLKAFYLTGVPYDLEHAASAALCMFLFGDSILRKIERIRIKFGMTFSGL